MRITVWYLLIDSEGKPFDENDAYRVYLDADSNPNVADLCDAVKSQNSVSLSHVDQRKLKVYNDIKEGRLEVDCPINGLGSSKNDALLVMVPSVKPDLVPDDLIMNCIGQLKKDEPPSSLAKSKNAKTFFSDANCRYKVHRPSDRSGDPVVLLEREFGNFVENCQAMNPQSSDYEAAFEFQSILSEFYNDELDRNAAVNSFLSKYLKLSVGQTGINSTSKRMMDIGHRIFNGIVVFHGGTSIHRTFNINCHAEVKNELGDGGSCAYLQQALYYGQSLPSNTIFHSKYRFPSFGLYICGPFFGITGLLFVNANVVCDPLTDFVPVLCPLLDNTQLIRIAKILAALKIGVHNLSHAANQLEQNLSDMPRVDTYPHFRYSEKLGTALIYDGRVAEKLVFRCATNQKDDRRRFIVKFTKTYCQQAHEFSESQGFAPKLHEIARLPGGWLAVLMDCVTLDRAVDITDPEKREQVTLLMDQYLDRFHSAGFVHGDFRPGNILVVYNPDDSVQSIKVIDFDSCGLQGRCHYPCSLNMRDINWAEDVDGGRLILPEHDRHFVDLYRNNCSTWRTGFY